MKRFKVFEFANGEFNDEFSIDNDNIDQVIDYLKDEILIEYQKSFKSKDITIECHSRFQTGHSHSFHITAYALDFDNQKSASSVHHYTVVQLF